MNVYVLKYMVNSGECFLGVLHFQFISIRIKHRYIEQRPNYNSITTQGFKKKKSRVR